MDLTDDLVREFAKAVNSSGGANTKTETTVYGTIKKDSDSTKVQLDGSELLTPISSTTDVEDGERVTVLIKDHQAIVNGNASSPSARTETVSNIDNRVVTNTNNIANVVESIYAMNGKFENLSVTYATIESLNATNARIDNITATEITVEYLEANYTKTEELEAEYATIESLNATNARIDNITSTEITVEYLEANYATIESLNTTNARIDALDVDNLDAKYATIESLNTTNARIDALDVDNLDAKYATIESLNTTNARIDALDVDNLDAKYATIESLNTTNARFDSLGSVYASITDLEASNARILELETNSVTTKYLETNYADIHLGNIDVADIGTFFANSGILEEVSIVDGAVTGTLKGVKIVGDVIEANTIAADSIILTGSEDSLIYQINVTSSGLTLEELADDIYKEKLNGTDIVASSITATQLNVDEIFANEAVVKKIFANNITATGTITGAKLKGADAQIVSGNIGGFIIQDNNILYEQRDDYAYYPDGTSSMQLVSMLWYSSGLVATDWGVTNTKVLWFGAHPTTTGAGYDPESGWIQWYKEEDLIYPFYVNDDGSMYAQTASFQDVSIRGTDSNSGEEYNLYLNNNSIQAKIKAAGGDESIDLLYLNPEGGYVICNGGGLVVNADELEERYVKLVVDMYPDVITGLRSNTESLSISINHMADDGCVYNNGVYIYTDRVEIPSDLTVSGSSTCLKQDYMCLYTENGAGSTGYWKLCTITTTGTYIGGPIRFTIMQRGAIGELSVMFNAVSNIASCDVDWIKQEGSIKQCYIIQTSSSSSACTFDIYVTKEEAYGALTVTKVDMSRYVRTRAVIAWSGVYASALPDGTTAASFLDKMNTTTVTLTSGQTATVKTVDSTPLRMIYAMMAQGPGNYIAGMAIGNYPNHLPLVSNGGTYCTASISANQGTFTATGASSTLMVMGEKLSVTVA